MMLKDKIIFLLSVSCLLISGCTEEMEVDLNTTYTRLVVDGAITTDSLSNEFVLKKSADYFSNEPAEVLTGATFKISSDNGEIAFVEDVNKPGHYNPSANGFVVTPDQEYNLTISGIDINENGSEDIFTASNQSVNKVYIDSINISRVKFREQDSGYFVHLYMFNPPGENYFLAKLYKNYQLVTDTLDEMNIFNDKDIEVPYIYGFQLFYLSESNNEEKLEVGDLLKVELYAMSEENYEFFQQIKEAISYQNPIFSGPPANVESNIMPNDMSVGYFNIFSTTKVYRVISQKDLNTINPSFYLD